MAPKRAALKCVRCQKQKLATEFREGAARKAKAERICKECANSAPKQAALKCFRCQKQKLATEFREGAARKAKAERICKECANSAPQRSGASRRDHELISCVECSKQLPVTSFSKRQRYSDEPVCSQCSATQNEPSLNLGMCNNQCEYCGAARFQAETRGFCCAQGKYVVDLNSYFPAPPSQLTQIFAASWPLKKEDGTLLYDVRTNQVMKTGFTALSRRYNNIFCLAQHEIQSCGTDKECKFGNVLSPANIRIHGTMYRKVFAATDDVPLRYLLIDPLERTARAASLALHKGTVTKLESLIIPKNPYMQQILRLSKIREPSATANIVLEWHEGLNEVAGIVDFHQDSPAKPRSVVFRRKRHEHPEYLDPLSPLYEPLSYPLWFPQGGRGWSTDVVSTTGHKITQMWWYRQLLLRCQYMHSCGRLLNEWLINMYCRMEDERFNHLRHQQRTRIAKRSEICEVLRNEPASTAGLGKTYYLPSSVLGSPRHLRRLRTDALELARRKGPPTWFITLTCNPYWPEIQQALAPGQTAADRPDIVVRVFHARLERMMKVLKEDFCGELAYIVKVIEYQRRGLPHAHIVLAAVRPPSSPEEVDAVISCELPTETGRLRTLVLTHMIHTCNHSCRPNDPLQDCIKGCPWPFADSTEFDVRGYPRHQRKPCGGHCPNCSASKAVYGKRPVCCNRLIVEYNAKILQLWEGHANVKYAGSVELFEYLYKYLFKGPDKANYDVTFDENATDEIKEWLRGRYLCATECAWRIFGYHTYERHPHVVCLPVHCENEDWVHFQEGAEDEALESSLSMLQRYFCRLSCAHTGWLTNKRPRLLSRCPGFGVFRGVRGLGCFRVWEVRSKTRVYLRIQNKHHNINSTRPIV